MMTLYFVNQTEYIQTLKDLKDEESCMGLIMIDNYDEMIDLLPDDKKTLILAIKNCVLNKVIKIHVFLN